MRGYFSKYVSSYNDMGGLELQLFKSLIKYYKKIS